MKIAVASKGGTVTEHFGYCESFNVFEVEKNQIVKSKVYTEPRTQARIFA